MGTRTVSKAPNPKSASWFHLGTKEHSPLPQKVWHGVPVLIKWQFKVDQPTVTSYTLMQNVDKHLCVEPYRETQNLEAGPMVTIYYSFTRYSTLISP